MFPHNITICYKEKENYLKRQIKGVFWYGSNSISISGKGIVDSNSISIVVPIANLEDFKIKKEMRIIKGLFNNEINSISELDDLDNSIIVSTINEYDVDTELDCVLIGGN